ncbi:MAG: hypothetical protein A3D74_01665 [Candidatus Levybacteria bacterium RIFCSPHIGHO2_02_FULL_37_13]|nr:MAG: hypothetical protein A3D74_01665 [Candidatus Levybacteria bacterium RIFCSPHIGHO2_02_FULL_37_13]OGH39644.1 MAG: hypothetical protein A3B41_03965 [Candidatus Levybacteria bacterium RIFCSPLOWO2_01_FULL_37_26]
MPEFSERLRPSNLLRNALKKLARPEMKSQIVVPRRVIEHRPTLDETLTQLRDQFHIQTVFYPGSGSDKIDGIFEKVVYFDAELEFEHFGKQPSPDSIRGLYYYQDYEKDISWGLPFRDGKFDALYHKDPDQLMASPNPFMAIVNIPLGIRATHEFLRVIKVGGHIVYVSNSCLLSPPLEAYKKIPGIEEIQEVNTVPDNLYILQKTKHISLDDVGNALEEFYREK